MGFYETVRSFGNYLVEKSKEGLNCITRIAPIHLRLQRSYRSLADSVQEKEDLIRRLQGDIGELSKLNTSRAREADEYKQQVVSLNASLEEGRTNLTRLGSEVAKLTQANAELGRKYNEQAREDSEKYAKLERKLQVQIDGAGHHKEEIRRLKRSSLELVAETYIAANPRDFVILIDEKDRIVAASERALKKLGYGSVEEISGIDVYSLIKKGEEVRASLKRRIRASLTDGKKERLREVLPDLAVENPGNGRKYNLNAVVVPHILGELTGHSRHYLGSMIVEESWRQTRLRERLERQEAEKKGKEEQANAAAESAKVDTSLKGWRGALNGLLRRRGIKPDEPETPAENRIEAADDKAEA